MSEPIPFEPPEPSELTELLEGYQVTSLIATGGMGAVYKAIQLSLERFVAIKLLPAEFGADPSFREQFRAEARSMARLNHANLIGIYDFGEAKGMPYIVMEFVAGKSLYYSSYGKAIDQSISVELVIGICRGLAHAHEAGLVHRDVKPANILLDPNAKPKIGDFGLAAAADADEEDGLVYGTPGYAAPEILSNPKAIGVPSDIYAVGVILYELLTGQMPEEPPSPPSSVAGCDKRLDPIFKKATRRNPALRYQQADEMAKDLREILPDLGRTRQRIVRTGSGEGSQKSVTLKRRLATDTGDDGQNGKPKLVALGKGEKAPPSKLNSGSGDSTSPATPTPAAVAVSGGSNWPIIRNLLIIAVLIPIIIFTWGIYQEKQAKLATEREEREIKLKEEQREQEVLEEKALREAAELERLEEERLAREEVAKKRREELLAIENSKTPMERLAEFRTALYNGRRDRFPDNTIDRSTHYLFFVNNPMTWSEAAHFAEIHGGHLATPTTPADIDVLTRRMGDDLDRIWIGGGAKGKNGWTWVTGKEWVFKDPGTTLGSCASLSRSGVIRARPNGERNPFVIQWSNDGLNPGSLASQLERLVPTLDAPSPDWPATTLSQESRHFLLIHQPVSWQEADLIAASAEGHLAVVSEPLEDRFLGSLIESSLLPGQAAWLGGQREGDLWTWTTGEPWTKANWSPNAPDGGNRDTALRYLRTNSGSGWDDANPKSGNATGLIIEWSPDANRKEVIENTNTTNPIGQFTRARKIARRFVKKEVEDYQKFLAGNRDTFMTDARVWYRLLNSTLKANYREAYNGLDENLPADGDFSGKVQVEGLPPELGKYLEKAIARQDRRKTALDEKIDSLRQSYLKKLMSLRDNFEKNGLKSQLETINTEISGIGQTAGSFRRAMEE